MTRKWTARIMVVAGLLISPVAVLAAPTANNQNLGKLGPGKETLFALSYTGSPTSFTIVSNPAHGTLRRYSTTSYPQYYYYKADTGYEGADSFTWKCSDASGDSNVATCSVTISSVPTANNQSATVVIGGEVAIYLSYSDPVGDRTKTFTILSGPVARHAPDLLPEIRRRVSRVLLLQADRRQLGLGYVHLEGEQRLHRFQRRHGLDHDQCQHGSDSQQLLLDGEFQHARLRLSLRKSCRLRPDDDLHAGFGSEPRHRGDARAGERQQRLRLLHLRQGLRGHRLLHVEGERWIRRVGHGHGINHGERRRARAAESDGVHGVERGDGFRALLHRRRRLHMQRGRANPNYEPSHGSLTVNGTTFTYTPATGYTGRDSFTWYMTY